MKTFYFLPLFFAFIFTGSFLFAQTDSSQQKYLTIHFLYGSKPAHGCKATEKKCFGGIHGGHVSMQIDSSIFSFTPKYGWHIISRHHKIEGGYITEDAATWANDTSGNKYISIRIPLADSQYSALVNLEKELLAQSPYDYAFLGMRCASACADVLSHLGIVKHRSNFGLIRKHFYPKRLRRKLLRYAKKNNLEVTRTKGRKTRKWERD
ncbi:MAG: hypothetical protein M3R17_17200 [Bacteroidota bacterium]|nr:hypothetical protein [Bacteroidota bacterium]